MESMKKLENETDPIDDEIMKNLLPKHGRIIELSEMHFFHREKQETKNDPPLPSSSSSSSSST